MESGPEPTRRQLLTLLTAIGIGTAATHMATTAGADDDHPGTDPEDIARIARDIGEGEPLTVVDLVPLENNIETVLAAAEERGFHVRPSLKSFQCPELCAYVLERLPEPRGMVFHMGEIEELLPVLPNEPDLMLGYVPTVGELERYFASTGEDEPPHRLRIMLDHPDLIRTCGELAANGNRSLPVEVALEFDSRMQRGGLRNTDELDEALSVLREYEDVLELTALMCYDGHATIESNDVFRTAIAREAQRRYRRFVEHIDREAADLVDVDELVRNGPGSSNYQNWEPEDVLTEVSPGTAFTYHGYLTESGFDNDGLEPTLYHAAPVMRIPAKGPRLPFLDRGAALTEVGFGDMEEVLLKGGGWPSNEGDLAELAWPEGATDNPIAGSRGNNASFIMAPTGELELGDYVLLRPQHSGDGIDYFSTIHAVRDGEHVGEWETYDLW